MTDDRTPSDGTNAAIAAILASAEEGRADAPPDMATLVRYLCRMASEPEAEVIEELALASEELRRDLATAVQTLDRLRGRPWPELIALVEAPGYEGEIARAWIRLAERMVPAIASIGSEPRRLAWTDLQRRVRTGIEDAMATWAILVRTSQLPNGTHRGLRPTFFRDAYQEDVEPTGDSSPRSAWIEDGDLRLVPRSSSNAPVGVYWVASGLVLALAEDIARGGDSVIRIPDFGRELGLGDGPIAPDLFVVGEAPETVVAAERASPVRVPVEDAGGTSLERVIAASLHLEATRREGERSVLHGYLERGLETHLPAYDVIVETLVSPGVWQVVGRWNLPQVLSEPVALDLPGDARDGGVRIPPLRARLVGR